MAARSLLPTVPRRLAAWGRGAVLLAPLLLLAALGLRGVQANRQAAFDHAKVEAERGLDAVLPFLVAEFAAAKTDALVPASYDAVPAPAAADEAQSLYAQALAAAPAAAAPLLAALAAEHRDARAPSGVPLLPLVEWARLRNETDPAALPERTAALARATVETHPSALTPELLTRADAWLSEHGMSDYLAPSLRRWEADERARAVLILNATILAAAHAPRWLRSEAGAWWFVPAGDGEGRPHLLPPDALAKLAERVAAKANALLPSYLSAAITLGDAPLLPTSVAGDTLARREHQGWTLAVVLVSPRQLYTEQRAQTRWLAALLACALAAALAAFWTMQRALLREQQLGELKSDFVASVSHELRAPVASMRLMAENLESGAVVAAERSGEYHRLIAEECRRLSALIENVLDFARIEQGRKVYDFAETDVAALARDAIALLQPRAAQRRQELRAEIAALDPPPCCDGLAVRQALINLLDNAIKFSPEATAITVRLAVGAGGFWTLSVQDEGPGISAAEHEKIFERFYRIGSELRRETQGAGIGLAIVKHIAEAHGGRAEVRSEPGSGATFTLVLPLAPCPAS